MAYLSSEIRNEIINNVNNDDRIRLKKKNWGCVKGGYLSQGNKIVIKNPEFDERLSEFLGIMFGDGNSYFKKEYKITVSEARITGDSRYDEEYFNFISKLGLDLFGLKGKVSYPKHGNVITISFYSINLIKKLNELGFPPGDKIKNKLKIPFWIKSNQSCYKAFIRGLIDTDGSIFRMSNQDPQLLRISLTNFIPGLLDEIRNGLIEMGFNPSKIIINKHFFLSRKADIKKYVNEIGFSNSKHINRLKILQNQSPVV